MNTILSTTAASSSSSSSTNGDASNTNANPADSPPLADVDEDAVNTEFAIQDTPEALMGDIDIVDSFDNVNNNNNTGNARNNANAPNYLRRSTSPFLDNVSGGSSMSDLLNGAGSLNEDSDDLEEASRAMLDRCERHLRRASHDSPSSLRRTQSTSNVAKIEQRYYPQANETDNGIKSESSKSTQQQQQDTAAHGMAKIRVPPSKVGNASMDTSPSSSGSADKESVQSAQSQQRNDKRRVRSMSINSTTSDEPVLAASTSAHVPSASYTTTTVPETGAVLHSNDGLWICSSVQDETCSNSKRPKSSTMPRAKSTASMRRASCHSHSQNSSKKRPRMRTIKSKRDKKQSILGKSTSSTHSETPTKSVPDNFAIPRVYYDDYDDDDSVLKSRRQIIDGDDDADSALPAKVIRASLKKQGIKCKMKLQSEWDCLTISQDQKWVALFSRHNMVLLRITDYGTFEQKKDIKAKKSDSRLKYGAVDAEFYPSDACKIVSCTRTGTLNVLNMNFAGRGCLALSDCKLRQRVHKVTWIPNTLSALAAAENKTCYLWDTRIEGNLLEKDVFIGGKQFRSNSPALSVKVSPFNENLFGSSHRDGTLNIWDIRNESAPFLTITAHKSDVNCIDWHPAIPNVVASCGYREMTIKVWNLTDDNLAQQKYADYWHKMSNLRNYNNEDDYRFGFDVSSPAMLPSNNPAQRYPTMSALKPNCSIYPSGHVSQIAWRPCQDAESLSANQIACSYVDNQQVVDLWDIKSSFVPVASLSSHESETKFQFMLRDRPFLDSIDDKLQQMTLRKAGGKFISDARTYLITCSKDKSVKLTDCGFADIPRSHLSSCALDIAPFGNTCFVSVPRQKLHPFDQETYRHDFDQYVKDRTLDEDDRDSETELAAAGEAAVLHIRKSSSMGELKDKSRDSGNDSDHLSHSHNVLQPSASPQPHQKAHEVTPYPNTRRTQRSYSGNMKTFPTVKTATNSSQSDGECSKTPVLRPTKPDGMIQKSPSTNSHSIGSSNVSPTRSVSTILGGMFKRRDKSRQNSGKSGNKYQGEHAMNNKTRDTPPPPNKEDNANDNDNNNINHSFEVIENGQSHNINEDEEYRYVDYQERDMNAMAGGFQQSKIQQLVDSFNQVDAFSQYETKLTCCPLNEFPSSSSPCDSASDFRYLAKHYKLSGKSIPWICQQNEKVAQHIHNTELAQLWRLLGVLLNNVLSSNNNKLPMMQRAHEQPKENKNTVLYNHTIHDETASIYISSPELAHQKERKSSVSQSRFLSHDEDDDDELEEDVDEWWMDDDGEEDGEAVQYQYAKKSVSETYSPGQLSPRSGSYLSPNSNSMENDSQHNHQHLNNLVTPHRHSQPLRMLQSALLDTQQSGGAEEEENENGNESEKVDEGEAAMVASYIKDVLEENIDRGDIQTAVTIIIMLKEYITQYLTEEEIADIVLSYLDLLLHDKLLREAVRVYECTKHYRLISEYFLSRNRLIVKCIRCKLVMRDHLCFRCNKCSRCSECNEELKMNPAQHAASWYSEKQKMNHPTLLIWCQICGHGGHYDHMIDWFESKKPCKIDNCCHQCQPVLTAMDSYR